MSLLPLLSLVSVVLPLVSIYVKPVMARLCACLPLDSPAHHVTLLLSRSVFVCLTLSLCLPSHVFYVFIILFLHQVCVS